MNRAGIDAAVLKIADDLYNLATMVLDNDTVSINVKTGENTLKSSKLRDDLATSISRTNGDDPVIKALFNNYVHFIEWDRPPMYGKQPPIDVLEDWAAKNGIPTDAATLWAISFAIWRDGHVGRPIFATMDTKLSQLFDGAWSSELFDAIVDDLSNFFN